MKKLLFLLVLTLSLTTQLAFASTINVTVDGEKVTFLSEPVNENGTTLVPMRQIFEALGASVEWLPETKQVKSVSGETTIVLTINSNVAQVNGSDLSLLVAPKIINGSTYVPTRFIAESLGAKVDWDGATKTVIVNSDTPTQIFDTKQTLGDLTYYLPSDWTAVETDSSIANSYSNGTAVLSISYKAMDWAVDTSDKSVANEMLGSLSKKGNLIDSYYSSLLGYHGLYENYTKLIDDVLFESVSYTYVTDDAALIVRSSEKEHLSNSNKEMISTLISTFEISN